MLINFAPMGKSRCRGFGQSFLHFVLASQLLALYPLSATAQAACASPQVPYSYKVSGRITDELSNPVGEVAIYGAPSPITSVSDGTWSITVSGCTLSPPRCGTGFNFQLAPVSPGYFFSPGSGEICPSNVVNFVRSAAKFTSTSAADYRNTLAPGAITTAFAFAGSALATGTGSVDISLPLPETLAGSTVTIYSFAGFTLTRNTRKAGLYFVSPNQINYYLPREITQGPAEIQIGTSQGLILRSSALIANIAPALFSANRNGQGLAAAVVQRVKPDDSVSYEPVTIFDAVQGMFEPVPIDLSSDSDRVFLDLFGTGIRNRSSLSQVSGKVGGVDSQVFYAGPQNEVAGLDQVNILLPRSLAGRGDVDVVLTIDGQATNPVTIRVR